MPAGSSRPAPAEQRSEMAEAGQRSRMFGTDGVRGVAGHELTARLALDLSAAAATVLGKGQREGKNGRNGPPVAVVGRDPRASGEFLEAAVVAGLASPGGDGLRLRVLPTPPPADPPPSPRAHPRGVLFPSPKPPPPHRLKVFRPRGPQPPPRD